MKADGGSRSAPRPQRAFDVAIAGGGPAGCATALALRAHAPSLDVALIEASLYDRPRLGETLPPIARRLIDHLDLAGPFDRQGHRAVHGTAGAWGSAVPRGRDYLFSTAGHGWHLDRRAFDAMLAGEAEARGVTVLRGARVDRADHAEAAGRGHTGDPPPEGGWEAGDPPPARGTAGWSLRLRGSGEPIAARFLVDATGPPASLARRLGARPVAADRLTAFARFFDDAGGSDPRVLVEAFADGWWYTAGLPGGLRIAACLTDADLARGRRLGESGAWLRCLSETCHVRQALAGARQRGPLLVRTAQTRQLVPPAGPGWLAVGDAASLFDPLSAQGILKALRSGIFAAYAIGDRLTAGDPRGLARYARHAADELARHRAMRARVYALESRWPASPFWQRRRGDPPRLRTR